MPAKAHFNVVIITKLKSNKLQCGITLDRNKLLFDLM